MESEPPVVKKRRFPVAIGSVRWGYNLNTMHMRWTTIAEDPQFYVDNVDTMTLKCYEDPYKQRDMSQMTQNFPFSPQKKHKRHTIYYKGIREHFLQHVNIDYSGQKNFYASNQKNHYICIVNWSVGDSKVKRHLPVDFLRTPTAGNSMGIFIQNERKNKNVIF